MRMTIRSVVALAAVAVLAATTGAAYANHVFPDVSTGSPFHTQVANIAAAGIATGFPDGTYRPQDPVNRQQMAAFINRGAGRVGFNSNTDLTAAPLINEVADVAGVSMTAGATGAEANGGFVFVTGSLTAQATASSCPCTVFAQIEDTTNGVLSDQMLGQISTEDAGFNTSRTSLSVNHVFRIDPDQTIILSLQGGFSAPATANGVGFTGQLSAVYVPFGHVGDTEL
jgi:S-layer homology domain